MFSLKVCKTSPLLDPKCSDSNPLPNPLLQTGSVVRDPKRPP